MIPLHQLYLCIGDREEVKVCSEQENNLLYKTQTHHREKD